MTNIYLIRHAEAEGNLYRIAQGQYNSIITTRGHRQIAALRRRFADIQVDAVYSSDLYRTCATASAVYQPKGLPLHRRADLREISVGSWEQRTWGEIAREQPDQMWNFLHRMDLWNVPGAEAPEAVRDRMMEAVREIAAVNPGKTVAVFSHGCAIQILLATIQGYPMSELGKTTHGENTAVSLLEVQGDEMQVVFRDDSSHLTDPAFAEESLIRKRNGLEPGLYFRQLCLPEQTELLHRCVSEVWADSGEEASWDPRRLLEEAQRRPTLVGYLQEEPVGLVQFHPERGEAENCGWISLYWVEETYRKRGYGLQLMGQAVSYFRPLGREKLRLALSTDKETAREHFLDYGFYPVGRTASGREILEKDISYHREFLEGEEPLADSGSAW